MNRSIDTAYPHVAILLCTYNGEKFITDQLCSIYKQSYTNWSIWVSDDHSQDATLTKVEKLANNELRGRIHVLKAQGRVSHAISFPSPAILQSKPIISRSAIRTTSGSSESWKPRLEHCRNIPPPTLPFISAGQR